MSLLREYCLEWWVTVVWRVILKSGYETNIKKFEVKEWFLPDLKDSNPLRRVETDFTYPAPASCEISHVLYLYRTLRNELPHRVKAVNNQGDYPG